MTGQGLGPAARESRRISIAARVLRRDGSPVDWSTRNMSGGGMFIAGTPVCQAGDVLDVGLCLPGSTRTIPAGVEVKWINDRLLESADDRLPDGMGVAFTWVAPQDHERIIGELYGLDPPTGDIDESPKEDRLAPGTLIGGYRIIDLLGAGGMGSVYMAEHVDLGRRVAVKRLHLKFSHDRDAIRRFFEEGRMVNRVSHEHVVEITDFISEGPEKLYVMELLEGPTLSSVIKSQGALPVGRALYIALQLADALDAVHNAGIVHRDLKPGNIVLVERHGTKDYLKLLDFGIAKLRVPSASLLETQPGLVVGTPAYIAPEYGMGNESDHRADVYSFAVLLYHMLAGELPFKAASWSEMLMKHVDIEAPCVSAAAPQPIPPALDALIALCLNKDPNRRPQTASVVAAELRELLAEENEQGLISDPLTPPSLRLPRPTKLQPTMVNAPPLVRNVLIIGALLIAALIATIWALLFSSPPRWQQPPPAAAAQQRAAAPQNVKSEGVPTQSAENNPDTAASATPEPAATAVPAKDSSVSEPPRIKRRPPRKVSRKRQKRESARGPGSTIDPFAN